MTRVIAEAPGKVVLLGEYAVLEGVPALALAINRRARVTLELCSPDECRVETPQLDIDPVRFALRLDATVEWKDALPEPFERSARLIEYLLADIHQRGGGIGPFRAHIDTGALFHVGEADAAKLGLGSSAAVAVALDAALQHAFAAGLESESPDEAVGRLLVPGRQAQHGAGSGIDLAASLTGGLIGYRIDGDEVTIEPLFLPPGLHLLFVWTGSPASTAELLAAWMQARRDRPDEARELLVEMASVAVTGLAGVRDDDAEVLVDRIGAYGRIMGKMNDLMCAPVLTAEHRKAMEHADRLGASYKPCGAGGGDIGVAATTQPGVIERLSLVLEEAGLTVLPLAASRRGVTIDEE